MFGTTKRLWPVRWSLTFLLAGAVCAMTACAPKPETPAEQDQRLKDQAAQTTVDIKRGAKQAAADAKVEAATAERKLNAIASGVNEGLHDKTGTGKPGAGRIDLNSASEDDLLSLPGITRTRARAILDDRPFDSPHDLVSKRIMTEAQYERISSRITAR